MNKYILGLCLLAGSMLSSCNDFLELKPQGQENSDNFMYNEENALRAVNGIYDLLTLSEGSAPDGAWLSHHHLFFLGSFTTDDADKGSKPSDYSDMSLWTIDPTNGVSTAFWIHGFWGVARANYVISKLPDSPIDENLKNRLMGEAYFLRGYYYKYLLKHFGGVPIFSEPVSPSQFGKVGRSSYHETILQIESDFKEAINRLPEKSEYTADDLGRATKGAARAFLARLYMLEIGLDAESTRGYDDVLAQTSAIINSGEYKLMANYANIFEDEFENNSESVFEVQAADGAESNDPGGIGTGYYNFQGNRIANDGAFSGWGFNNPTQDLVNAFDPTDPRISNTVYGPEYNEGIIYGLKCKYDVTEQGTNYLNRKGVLMTPPAISKQAPRNIILMRYADVLLMHAEAAFENGNEQDARKYVNMIRERARNSSYCKGFNLGDPIGYPKPAVTPNIPDITASGDNLREAIRQERRRELAMENYRAYDLMRWGVFIDAVKRVKENPENPAINERTYAGLSNVYLKHCLTGKNNRPILVMPVPLNEQQNWGLSQNPGY